MLAMRTRYTHGFVLGVGLATCFLAAPAWGADCKDVKLFEICGTDQGEPGRPPSAGGAQNAWSAKVYLACYNECKGLTCDDEKKRCMLNGVSRKEGVTARPIRSEGRVTGFEFCAEPTCKCRCDQCEKDAALKDVPRGFFRGAGGNRTERRTDAKDRARRWCSGEADNFTPGPGHGECKRFPCSDPKKCVAAEAIGEYEGDGFVLKACKCKCE